MTEVDPPVRAAAHPINLPEPNRCDHTKLKLQLDHSTDVANAVRRVLMGIPSLADDSIIEVLAEAFCVGMDVDTPSGVQHHRCGFKAIAAQVCDRCSNHRFDCSHSFLRKSHDNCG